MLMISPALLLVFFHDHLGSCINPNAEVVDSRSSNMSPTPTTQSRSSAAHLIDDAQEDLVNRGVGPTISFGSIPLPLFAFPFQSVCRVVFRVGIPAGG